jgi:hypothetical protein
VYKIGDRVKVHLTNIIKHPDQNKHTFDFEGTISKAYVDGAYEVICDKSSRTYCQPHEIKERLFSAI